MPTHPELGAIISIGDELAIGQSLDTNSRWLSARLTDLGVTVAEHVTVPDDVEAITSTLRRLCGRCGVLVITGGLGPTADDLTRDALAALTGEPLVEDEASLATIKRWFERSQREMPIQNRVQALRPRSASHLPNEFGTAPGIQVVCGSTTVFCLPGPPSEMQPMFEAFVAPALARVAMRSVRTAVFQTVGLGESDVAQRLGELMARDRMPLVGTTASGGIVSVRVRYEGNDSSARVDTLMESTANAVRDTVGEWIFAEAPATLAEAVMGRLRQANQRLAVVESCTGGMLGQAVSAVPGSSDVFVGGCITYSNEMKQRLVGVPGGLLRQHGAVSREVADAMASGGLATASADHCLAITGIAGPGGGSASKPVGTVWIALASRGSEIDSRLFQMRGGRDAVRQWAVTSALAMLDLRLRNKPRTRLLREQTRHS